MNKTEWIRCPVCGNKIRLQIREDTELKNIPPDCPKCKQESLIEAKALQVAVVKRLENAKLINKAINQKIREVHYMNKATRILFTFLFGYVYIVPFISLNNSFI